MYLHPATTYYNNNRKYVQNFGKFSGRDFRRLVYTCEPAGGETKAAGILDPADVFTRQEGLLPSSNHVRQPSHPAGELFLPRARALAACLYLRNDTRSRDNRTHKLCACAHNFAKKALGGCVSHGERARGRRSRRRKRKWERIGSVLAARASVARGCTRCCSWSDSARWTQSSVRPCQRKTAAKVCNITATYSRYNSIF